MCRLFVPGTNLAILAALLALAPIRLSAVRRPIRVYSTALGMPTTSANCLTPDANGLLWICTNAGLVRFDGSRFHVFGPEEGLPSRRVLGFVISRRGGYWVTTDVGVCRLPPGSKVGDRCELLSSDKGEFLSEGLVELEDGTTFIATRDRVFRASAGGHTLEPAAFENGPPVRLVSIAALRDGRMLIGTENGLLIWRKGELSANRRRSTPGRPASHSHREIEPGWTVVLHRQRIREPYTPGLPCAAQLGW